ncbi:hypothetical protein BDV95DRAFT_497890, partial [Massariosphaeria phaeospora]
AQAPAPDSSRRNITASSPPLSSHRNSHVSQSHSQALRPNAPLKPLSATHRSTLPNTLGSSPTATSRARPAHITPLTNSTTQAWTHARLATERNDWWDTRITGAPEIWKAVRMMVEHLQAGEVAEAQTLLDVTESTCPSGLVWKGVYDRRGEAYVVPRWVVFEPAGLGKERVRDSIDMGVGGGDGTTDTSLSAAPSKPYKVRCRLTTQAKDIVIEMHRGEKVASLIRKLKVKAGLQDSARVRIVYAGKFYADDQPLEANDMWKFEGHVLVAMVLSV